MNKIKLEITPDELEMIIRGVRSMYDLLLFTDEHYARKVSELLKKLDKLVPEESK